MQRAILIPFLLVAFAVSLNAQPLQFTVEQGVLERPGLKAILVSNQYGVLRYFTFAGKLEDGQPHRFSVMRRRGEQLALTLVEEEERDGFYSFRNSTYTNLSDSCRIEALQTQTGPRRNFRTVNINVTDVEGINSVRLRGPLGRRTEFRITGDGLRIKGSVLERTGIYALMQFPDEDHFRYYMQPMDEENEFEIQTDALGDSVAFTPLLLPYSADWSGSVQGYQGGTPYYLHYRRQGMGDTDSLEVEVPVGERFDSVLISLSALQEEGTAYFKTLDQLPARLDTFLFESDFDSLTNKSFTFSAVEEEGDYYAVSYYYSLGQGRPIPSWHVWGAMQGRQNVDFILPDLPQELYEIMPELEEVVAPIAVDKTSFRCTRRCTEYDFGRHPALLEDNEGRFYHGFISRRHLQELED